MQRSPLDKYLPITLAEVPNFKPGTYISFSGNSPLHVNLIGLLILTYPLENTKVMLTYFPEAQEESVKLWKKLLTKKQIIEMVDTMFALKKSRVKSEWRPQATIHYGVIIEKNPERILVDCQYLIPQQAQALLKAKPGKVAVRKTTFSAKPDFDQRMKSMGKLFTAGISPKFTKEEIKGSRDKQKEMDDLLKSLYGSPKRKVRAGRPDKHPHKDSKRKRLRVRTPK